MRQELRSRYDVLQRLAGEFQVEGVRAKLDIVIPSDGSVRSDVHLFEITRLVPGLEHAAACETGQVNRASQAVGILNPYPVSRTRFYVNRSNHPSGLRVEFGRYVADRDKQGGRVPR